MKQKVIFWGCGNIAKEVYHKFKNEIEILYAISNDPKEIVFTPEKGQEFFVKRPAGKTKTGEGMIVICSADYERIAEQLSLMGFIPFVDFMDYELAEIMWVKKKVVLLYGFCHLRGIADCLKKTETFLSTYAAIYYPNYLFSNYYQQVRLQYLVDHCSFFIYGMALSPENYRKNKAILERLRPQVKTVCLHAAYFGAYFPQIRRTYNEMNEYAVKCEGYDYTPFSYGDSWLNACIARGMRLEDILDGIENREIYKEDFVLKYAEEEWTRLRYQEKNSDFRIIDYIEKNYRNHRLFRNETHMENCILSQYAMQILQRLGCPAHIDMDDTGPLLNCSQHFIYPCVANALKLEWDVWQEKLDLYTYGGWKKVSMKEYIQLYYESCSRMRQLKGKHFLP